MNKVKPILSVLNFKNSSVHSGFLLMIFADNLTKIPHANVFLRKQKTRRKIIDGRRSFTERISWLKYDDLPTDDGRTSKPSGMIIII